MLSRAAYYQAEIAQVNSDLKKAFKLLKKRKGTQSSQERERIKKQIKKLVDKLQDLKYRSAFA